MKVEVITYDADPERGGFGARVHGLVRMLSQFAEVRVVLTDWFTAPSIPGVEYVEEPVHDRLISKLRRLRTYYKTDHHRRDVRSPPDVVIVESLDLLGLHQYGDQVPLVLDEHNVYWNVLEYEMVNSQFFHTWLGRRPLVRTWLVPHLLKRAKGFELEALRRASGILVTSKSDRDSILAELPEAEGKVRILPNCVDAGNIKLTEPSDTTTVVFVGNFNYVPNRDGATHVMHTLAPMIPEATFLLVGSGLSAQEPPQGNVKIMGHVKDVRSVMERATVCIAPVTKGSGTRLKILTYLAFGRPVVATTKACEGLGAEDGIHLIIRDTWREFGTAIRTLLDDPGLRSQLGAGGRRLVETKFDWRVYVDWMRNFMGEVMRAGNLPTRSGDR